MASFVASSILIVQHRKLPGPQLRKRHRRVFPQLMTRPSLRDVLSTGFREVRVGSVVVPRHRWNRHMRHKGVYRSVEYVVECLTLDGRPVLTTRDVDGEERERVEATLRPLNRLLPRFERAWPVKVAVAEARLLSYAADLLSCALVTVALSAFFLGLGAVGPRYVSIYSIPSASMYPALQVGDALLVEKVSLQRMPPVKGEIVLFRPPHRLSDMMRTARKEHVSAPTQRAWSSSVVTRLHRNDLFVKRVAAVGGDVIEVSGNDVKVNGVKVDSAAPGSPNVAPRKIPEGYVFVVGDNAERSLDSRYWGLLPVDHVVGRPLARIFPLDRFDVRV